MLKSELCPDFLVLCYLPLIICLIHLPAHTLCSTYINFSLLMQPCSFNNCVLQMFFTDRRVSFLSALAGYWDCVLVFYPT